MFSFREDQDSEEQRDVPTYWMPHYLEAAFGSQAANTRRSVCHEQIRHGILMGISIALTGSARMFVKQVTIGNV